MDQLPRTYHGSRRDSVLLLGCGIAILAMTVSISGDGAVRGLGQLASVVVIVSAIQQIIRPNTLTMRRDGVDVRYLWRRRSYEFVRCGPFRRGGYRMRAAVLFTYSDMPHHVTLQQGGYNKMILDTCGIDAGVLASDLNRLRDEAVAAT